MKKKKARYEVITEVYEFLKGMDYKLDGGSEYISSSGWESYMLQQNAARFNRRSHKLGARLRGKNRCL